MLWLQPEGPGLRGPITPPRPIWRGSTWKRACAAGSRRIELVALRIENDNRQGRLLIDITYRVRATQEVASLIYSFNLEQPA